MKIIANGPTFVFLYIILMLPTYVLPYLGSNSAGIMAIQSVEIDGRSGTLILTFLHLSCLALLIFITFLRAKFVDKLWLTIFPFLAAVFDFVPLLSMIPLVPTIMHILAMILGVAASSVIRTEPKVSD